MKCIINKEFGEDNKNEISYQFPIGIKTRLKT